MLDLYSAGGVREFVWHCRGKFSRYYDNVHERWLWIRRSQRMRQSWCRGVSTVSAKLYTCEIYMYHDVNHCVHTSVWRTCLCTRHLTLLTSHWTTDDVILGPGISRGSKQPMFLGFYVLFSCSFTFLLFIFTDSVLLRWCYMYMYMYSWICFKCVPVEFELQM